MNEEDQAGVRHCWEATELLQAWEQILAGARSALRKLLAAGTATGQSCFTGGDRPPHACFAGTDETSFVGVPVVYTYD